MPMIGQRCRECGVLIQGKRVVALFCSGPHRQAFNRRRRDRGAELYDFVMGGDAATVARLKAAYVQADHVLRSGRKSHQPPAEAKGGIPAAFGDQGDGR